MSGKQSQTSETITREQWLRVLSDNRRDYWASRHFRERRQDKRNQIRALATVTFKPTANSETPITWSRCPVLDVSATGLAIRTYQKIAPGTRLSLEITVGDRKFMLVGVAANHHGFPGAIRVGVALEFPATAGETTAAGD